MATYGDPDTHAQMGGGPGPYGNQNGTPPAQQQQQHLTDPELRLQENLQQLRDGGDMIHAGGQHQPQYQQLQMGPTMGAHQQFQAPPRPTHSPQQMAHAVMSLEGHPDAYDPNDPNRKRSKVSRACDECRRKKIRCDATSENGPEPCSSCKRTLARCQFSRQPMKRGPSKGYIKELADRLNSLESQIQHPQGTTSNFDFVNLGDQSFLEAQSPPRFKRQRTHSMTEGFHEAFGRSSWSGQDREPSMNGHHRNSFGELNLAGNLITGSNEGTLKAYYTIIHPTLPVLPHHDSALNRLSNCPPKLREAFFLALECAIRSLAPKALPGVEVGLTSLLQQSSLAVEAANWSLNDTDNSRQFYNHVIFCEALILLAIASDRPSSANVKSPSLLLGQINGLIALNGLNDSATLAMLKQQDLELFHSARRVYWVARILDSFYASSKSKDTMFEQRGTELLRDDITALGDVGYHLARASKILGIIHHARQSFTVPRADPVNLSFDQWLESRPSEFEHLHGRLQDFSESLAATDLTDNSPPYLAHYYLDVVVARLSSQHAPSSHLLATTKSLLSHLISGSITPLHHVLAPLVVMSLNDLADRVETQVEAHSSIKEMSDALASGQIVHRSLDGTGWDATIQDLLHQKKGPSPPMNNPPEQHATEPNMVGLQHLAAAAVGEREGTDARPASSSGNAAAQVAKVESDLSAAMAAANEAAKAQATAAAAQQLSSPSGNGDMFH